MWFLVRWSVKLIDKRSWFLVCERCHPKGFRILEDWKKHATSPIDEFVDGNEDGYVDDFEHASFCQGSRFWQQENLDDERFW